MDHNLSRVNTELLEKEFSNRKLFCYTAKWSEYREYLYKLPLYQIKSYEI